MYEKKGDPDFTINLKVNQKKKKRKIIEEKIRKKLYNSRTQSRRAEKIYMDISMMVVHRFLYLSCSRHTLRSEIILSTLFHVVAHVMD